MKNLILIISTLFIILTSFQSAIGQNSATVKGSASYSSEENASKSSHYQKSNNAKYTVNVHAKQLDLPLGVTTIIQAFSNAIEPLELTV